MPSQSINRPQENEVVATLYSDLDFLIRYSSICFTDEDDKARPDVLFAQCTPLFNGYNFDLKDDCVVYDIFSLIESAKEEGLHWLLTCECGIADDVGIYAACLVSHPDTQTIVWEFEISQYQDLLIAPFNAMKTGWLRIIFERQAYQSAIQRMVIEVQYRLQTLIPFHMIQPQEFTRTFNYQTTLHDLQKKFIQIKTLQIEDFNPLSLDDLDALLALDADHLWDEQSEKV